MCSHYHAMIDPQRTRIQFGAAPPTPHGAQDMWPGSMGVFIRRAPAGTPITQALTGLFGLLPQWSQETAITRVTYNARCEDIADKPTYRQAWNRAQHCIIPADAFFEPHFQNGKPVSTRVTLTGEEPMGIAGLWACGSTPKGDIYSFTMLTVNADQHALMRRFRQRRDEKRMVVILPPERYQDWLDAPVEHSQEFMQAYPAKGLLVVGWNATQTA